MGLGNVAINVVWKLLVVAIYAGALRAHPAAAGSARLVDVGPALPPRRPRLLLVPPRLAREPRLLGQPRRAPLERPLQPLDGAAPDLGADDLPAVLAGAAAARLRAVDGPAGPELVAHLPVRPAHRAHRAPALAPGEGAQHALAPPRPPRLQRAVPRPQLRRDPRRLGPALRHLRARGRARPLRPDDERGVVQPGPRRLPRVRRALGATSARRAAGASARGCCGTGRAGALSPRPTARRARSSARRSASTRTPRPRGGARPGPSRPPAPGRARGR